MKKLQLTSRSFTTIEPDQPDERRYNLRHSLSQSAETSLSPDHPDIPRFSIVRPCIGFSPSSRSPARVDQSDQATQTDVSMVAGDEKLLSTFRPKTYTTGLHVDRMVPTANVPLQEDTEVMVVLEGLSRHRLDSSPVPFSSSSRKNDGKNQKRFLSTVEVESSIAANGCVTLTPVTSRSMEVTQGRPTDERFPEVMERLSGQCDVSGHHHLDSMVTIIIIIIIIIKEYF